MKVGKWHWVKLCSVLTIAFLALTPWVSAVSPPYTSGGAGQWTEGNASVWETEINLNDGTIRMLGMAGAAGLVTYGRADSWGYFEVRTTATQNGHIHPYTRVEYYGHVQQYCYVIWIGYAEARIWILQKIRVRDITNNWQVVGENSKWVYDEGVKYAGSKSKDFNHETHYLSVDAPVVAGHTYSIEVWVECQCAAQAALGGVAQSSYTFAGDYYTKVQYISWYYYS